MPRWHQSSPRGSQILRNKRGRTFYHTSGRRPDSWLNLRFVLLREIHATDPSAPFILQKKRPRSQLLLTSTPPPLQRAFVLQHVCLRLSSARASPQAANSLPSKGEVHPSKHVWSFLPFLRVTGLKSKDVACEQCPEEADGCFSSAPASTPAAWPSLSSQQGSPCLLMANAEWFEPTTFLCSLLSSSSRGINWALTAQHREETGSYLRVASSAAAPRESANHPSSIQRAPRQCSHALPFQQHREPRGLGTSLGVWGKLSFQKAIKTQRASARPERAWIYLYKGGKNPGSNWLAGAEAWTWLPATNPALYGACVRARVPLSAQRLYISICLRFWHELSRFHCC